LTVSIFTYFDYANRELYRHSRGIALQLASSGEGSNETVAMSFDESSQPQGVLVGLCYKRCEQDCKKGVVLWEQGRSIACSERNWRAKQDNNADSSDERKQSVFFEGAITTDQNRHPAFLGNT
jgi:hypothetical protein